ncbi:MAG: translation initiation factor IF-3 [Bacteroidia bacterium]|nr:translation initiation factor IF-3 [Bacteroidia bacterium]
MEHTRGFFKTDNNPQYRVNNRIRAKVVRVVGENVENPGVYSIDEALRIADRLELDLVEVSPNADPPVCKVVDFQKFLYQLKRKQKELKSKATKVVVKEIRFGPHTDDHDFRFKVKHAQKFIEDGAKVKAYVFFKGRTILFKEQGEAILQRMAKELEEIANIEMEPRLEGKRMIMILIPNPKVKKKV